MPDVHLLRRDLRAFAAEVSYPLEPWQAPTLDSRVTVIVAGRQLGKSRFLTATALWWAFRRPEQRVLIVSAGELGSRRLLADIRRIAVGSELLSGSVVDEQAALIQLTNGSELRSVPASEKQVRGWAVDLLLIDEAGSPSADLILSAAIPTVSARPHGRIVLADSAWSADGPFFDHAQLGDQGSEHVRTFRWVAKAAGGGEDAPWITPSMVELARASLGDLRFRAEYLGEFASAPGRLFTRRAIDRVTHDFVITPLSELHGQARVAAGIDWAGGTGGDHSALVAIAGLQAPAFVVCTAERWPDDAPLHRVVEAIASAPAHFHTITAEINGLGLPVSQDLVRRLRARPPEHGGGMPPRPVLIDPIAQMNHEDYGTPLPSSMRPRPRPGFCIRKNLVHTSSENKAVMFSTVRLLIDREQLLFPASATELLRELVLLSVDLTPGGSERIAAATGHDDLAMALGLALGPYRSKQDGKWRTLVGDFAERLTPGDGSLQLPRVPSLLSISGDGLTTAPPAATADPHAEQRARAREALKQQQEVASG